MESDKLVITALPAEILCDILVHLDYSSLLAAKLTCKTFYSVTRSRQFWYDVLGILKEKYSTPSLEEELDNYSIEELEHWISKRSRTQDIWAGIIQPHFRNRTIIPHPDIEHPHTRYWNLLPGGRWLLTAHPRTLTIYVLDLDSTNPQPRLLFDASDIDQRIDGGQHKINHFVSIDRSKPRLSFRIAGIFGGREKPQTYIYQVDLVGHGADAKLVATRYLTFQHYRRRVVFLSSTFAINGHYVVELVDHTEPSSNKEIIVYHYCEAEGKPGYSLIKPIIYPFDKDFCKMVQFIHENIFIVVTASVFTPYWSTLHIFEIICHNESTSPDHIKLIHTMPLDYILRSNIHWSPGISQLVLLKTSHEIEGLFIPHDTSIQPTIVHLGDCTLTNDRPESTCRLGITVSLFFSDPQSDVEVVAHWWNSNQVMMRKHIHACDCVLKVPSCPIAFAEDVGRVVFVKDAVTSFFVLDFI